MAPFVPNRNTYISKVAKSILNQQELKVGDTTFSGLTVDSTMEIPGGSINLITQGDAVQNRDGNVVEVKSVEWSFDFQLQPAASANGSTVVHFWLIQDRQPNGAMPAISTIFTSDNAALATTVAGNQYRFKILKRDVVVMNSPAGVTTAYNNSAAFLNGYHKFKKPVQIRFNGNAGTVADVSTNNFFVVMGSTFSDDLVTFSGWTRLRFTG